jgi:hypothetical protein
MIIIIINFLITNKIFILYFELLKKNFQEKNFFE